MVSLLICYSNSIMHADTNTRSIEILAVELMISVWQWRSFFPSVVFKSFMKSFVNEFMSVARAHTVTNEHLSVKGKQVS